MLWHGLQQRKYVECLKLALMKTKIRVWNVSLFRKNGDFVDSTQVDEKKESLAKELFYGDFEINKIKGDRLEWEEGKED
jgi:hypothetical protein